ncbi:hypothetical protein [Lacticaseibacillus jixiensis]|uniref:hypothetical protein n=1 Tax=Lacticaseibacillus jixiensis TaxID=3231926 RepID=UPI0036F2F740
MLVIVTWLVLGVLAALTIYTAWQAVVKRTPQAVWYLVGVLLLWVGCGVLSVIFFLS